MKLALGQIDMGFEQPQEAMALCSRLLAEAAAAGAELAVFPEMTLTGFTLAPERYAEARADSPTIAFFRAEAQRHGIAVCFGLPVREDGVATNHCIYVDKTGEILADYSKLHPFSYGAEAKHYVSGDDLQFCSVAGVPFSPLICYDLRFPEVFQVVAERSVCITVIASWPASRRAHWRTLLQARAIETQSFLIGVNRCGTGGGLSYAGDSMVVAPDGTILADAGEKNGLTFAEIDPAQAAALRQSFPLRADRKPALYHALWQKYRLH